MLQVGCGMFMFVYPVLRDQVYHGVIVQNNQIPPGEMVKEETMLVLVLTWQCISPQVQVGCTWRIVGSGPEIMTLMMSDCVKLLFMLVEAYLSKAPWAIFGCKSLQLAHFPSY